MSFRSTLAKLNKVKNSDPELSITLQRLLISKSNIIPISEQSRQKKVYFADDYGAKGDSVTDNTIILQNLIDTVTASGGGVIELGVGIYKITSTLLLPVGGPTMASAQSITIRGQFRPPYEFWYLQTPIPYIEGERKGTVLMNSNGTVISSAGTTLTAHRLNLENITIVTSDNPNWDGLDFSRIVDIYIKDVVVTTGKHGSNASYPTHQNTCALRMTGGGNRAVIGQFKFFK